MVGNVVMMHFQKGIHQILRKAREMKECNNGIGYKADIEKTKYFGNMVNT